MAPVNAAARRTLRRAKKTTDRVFARRRAQSFSAMTRMMRDFAAKSDRPFAGATARCRLWTAQFRSDDNGVGLVAVGRCLSSLQRQHAVDRSARLD